MGPHCYRLHVTIDIAACAAHLGSAWEAAAAAVVA